MLMGILFPANLMAIPMNVRNENREMVKKEVDNLLETMKKWGDRQLKHIYLNLRDNARWDQMGVDEFDTNIHKLDAMFHELKKRGMI